MMNCQKFYFQKDQEIIPGSPEHFTALTGATWVDEMKVSTLTPYEVSNSFTQEMGTMQDILALYSDYLQNPPKLYINPGKEKESNTLHALEEISKGTLITEYLGEWMPTEKANSHYRWGPIEGKKFRNYGGMIDDGFPNLGAFHLFDVNAIPLRVVFVALETIRPHEILTTNYGMDHSVKMGDRREHRLEEMVRFFSTNPLTMIVDKIKELIPEKKNLSWNSYLEFENLVFKLQYLFQTPAALELFLERSVAARNVVFDIYDSIDNKLYLLGFYSKSNRHEKAIMSAIEAIRKKYN